MSANKIKQEVSLDALSVIFNKHSLGKISSATVMTGGEYNSVCKVETQDTEKYVIKLAPKTNVEVLTYENNLIKSEVNSYEKLASLKTVQIPKIYGYCFNEKEPYQYLIMEFIDGKMLSDLKLDKCEYDNIMFDLGKAMAEIHNLENTEGFGYIQNGLKETWKEAFFSMIENVIADGERKNAKIPYLNEIRKLINDNAYILDEVKNPSLIHFDLWAGNIFIKDNKLYSIIDCERAMYGDVMGEFVSLDYITPFSKENNKSLIDGYNSLAKIKIEFNNRDMLRLYLMRLYLGLIVCVETYYRYPKLSKTFFSRYNFSKKVLKTTINELKKYV